MALLRETPRNLGSLPNIATPPKDEHLFSCVPSLSITLQILAHMYICLSLVLLVTTQIGTTHCTRDRYHSEKRSIDCASLQHTATRCNSLQHTATHCNTLQQVSFWKAQHRQYHYHGSLFFSPCFCALLWNFPTRSHLVHNSLVSHCSEDSAHTHTHTHAHTRSHSKNEVCLLSRSNNKELVPRVNFPF